MILSCCDVTDDLSIFYTNARSYLRNQEDGFPYAFLLPAPKISDENTIEINCAWNSFMSQFKTNSIRMSDTKIEIKTMSFNPGRIRHGNVLWIPRKSHPW